MSLRIPTALMHDLAVRAMLQQQGALSRTQQQIASGQRILSPADDPAAAVQLQELMRNRAQQEQYGRNSDIAQSRLQLEEQALADTGTLLQRVQELVLQANNATLSDPDRRYIGTELRARVHELQAIANRRDATGHHLFSGLSGAIQPFARTSAGAMAYLGDSGARALAIDANAAVQDGDAGDTVFQQIVQGNGYFTTEAVASNTGSGSIDTGAMLTPGSWTSSSYTIGFTAPNVWQLTDALGTAIGSGAYVSGATIAVNGAAVAISGAPAAGDRFVLRSAGQESIFATLDRTIVTLEQGAGNEAGRAQLHTALGGVLLQLDQANNHLYGVRAQVGARLALIDDAEQARLARIADATLSISALRDLDYASAVSRMSQQLTSLEAAQRSYASVARLSLFDYL